jgi:hypothetical protein
LIYDVFLLKQDENIRIYHENRDWQIEQPTIFTQKRGELCEIPIHSDETMPGGFARR